MKILFVVNNAFVKGNGLSSSCRRTVRFLKEAGDEVRILSGCGKNGERPEYALEDTHIPVFDGLITSQGYIFAKADKKTIREAVRWADVVHLEEPFLMEIKVLRIALKEGVPVTATYHLHPENIFSSIHLENSRLFNGGLMMIWRDLVFNKCSIIQCPTENVRERLERWHFKPELRVISNGMIPIDPEEIKRGDAESRAALTISGKRVVTIVSTGRYSVEKDQMTILKSMRYSKYADRIRLVFAGQGPLENRLRKKAEKLVSKGRLNISPEFVFMDRQQLNALYDETDIYVHAARTEVEGLACMEAIERGIVPVIARDRHTATSQFALCENSIFPGGNAKALAERLDYWIEDDERRKKEAAGYIGISKKYDIRLSIEKLREMFEDACRQEKKGDLLS